MTHRFRLFPIIIVTAVTVAGLKLVEVVHNSDISITSINTAVAQEKPSEKNAAQKGKGEEKPAKKPAAPDKTAENKPKKAGEEEKNSKENEDAPKEQVVTNLSQSEIALLSALSKRRKELDEREKKLDYQSNLLKAIEKRIDEKIKKLEKIKTDIELRTVEEKKIRNDKFKKLVSIYEGMKPKEAARIFSRLDSKVVLQVAERIAPRKMSEILAKMDAESAERLTIQLANKASGEGDAAVNLPQIGDAKSG